jgi:hypothetical protein
MDQLGPNALGETLRLGRVADCYLGLLLPPRPAGEPEAGTVLVVAPGRVTTPRCSAARRQPGLRAAHRPPGAGAR